MAEQRAAVEEPPAEDQGNSFSNDGSFMEQFKKMAEQKAKEEQAKREAEKAKINKPLFSRVTKKKPVVMKLGGFRKKLLPGANLDKPLAKAFVVDEKSGVYILCTYCICIIDCKLYVQYYHNYIDSKKTWVVSNIFI